MSGLQFSLRGLLLAVAMFSVDCAIVTRASWEGAIFIAGAAILAGVVLLGMTICVALEDASSRRVKWYTIWLESMLELGIPLVTVWATVALLIGLMDLVIETHFVI